MNEYFFRVNKIKGAGIIKKAARHNKRQIQRELGAASHIHAHLMKLNEVIYGPPTADNVTELAERLMAEAGVTKLRKDAVKALEAVFSLPINHRLDDKAYFKHCTKWFIKTYGGVLLSADIHRDESAPHCHVLMLPLIEGRMRGNAAFGKKPEHAARVNAFFRDVASLYGLKRPNAKASTKDKEDTAYEVIKALRGSNDPALKSVAWHAIRQSIEADPMRYAAALGIGNKEKAPKPAKTMAQIFTSKGKGSNAIAFDDGHDVRLITEKKQRLSCVAFQESTPLTTAPALLNNNGEEAARFLQ